MACILYEIKNGVAFIRLNRPEKYNAFNREMALSLQEALANCTAKEIRAVCIMGSGKAFCSGQDLEEIIDPKGPRIETIVGDHYNPIVLAIRKLAKPVIAAVNGVAAGAGANIALCCDIVVATQSATFIQIFSKIGLVPDSGGTFFLPRLIGWQKASALMMLGDKVTAEEAERMGMIYKYFSDETFEEEVKKMAFTLAAMPTKGLAYTKQLLNTAFANTYEDQLEDEENFQQRAGATKDFKEGVAAFMEKRKANFVGE